MNARTVKRPLPPGMVDGFCTHCKAEVDVSIDTLRCPDCGRMVDPLSLPRVPDADELPEPTRLPVPTSIAAAAPSMPTPSTTLSTAMQPRPVAAQPAPVSALAADTLPAGQALTLPAIREAKAWNISTDALIAALEREEAAALSDFEAFKRGLEARKARVIAARQSLTVLKRIRGAVRLGDSAAVASGWPVPTAVWMEKTDRVESGDVVAGGKRWSRKFDRCQDPACVSTVNGVTRVKHAANGICGTCYKRQRA